MPASPFRMPAEWEEHEATWLAWPHEKSDWPGKFAPIPWVYGQIVQRLARHERVRILVDDAAVEQRARKVLKQTSADLAAVEFFRIGTDRSWCRDFCPIFVRDASGRLLITDWRFNGWAKYDNWRLDDAVPSAVARALRIPRVQPKLGRRCIVLEGGAIDVNGAGLMLTTEECLLSNVQARNPGLGRDEIEGVFRDWLGVRKTLWLRNGIAGDDTHGHVDDLARFVSHDGIVIVVERNRDDANYEPLRENLALARRMTDARGRPLRVFPLPMPEPIEFAGQRLPASYANFYIGNRTVLVPVFNDTADRVALNTLARLFPDREVCPIYCGDLVLGLGTLHCMTQQQPVARGVPR